MTTGGHFFDQFIEDYFAECDEHLAAIRRVLLSLEAKPDRPPEPADVHALSRALHTLKGLSGMVGLAAAERVAHAMEDGVRGSRAGEPFGAELIEALFSGSALLERCVAARRAGRESPDVDAFVESVQATVRSRSQPRDSAPTSVEAESGHAESPSSVSESRLFEFTFTPSAEQAARGVGVESIRARLQSLGKITQSKPRILDGGAVAFEFAVIARPGQRPDDEWRADGLTWSQGPIAPAGASAPIRRDEPDPVPVSSVVRVDLARVDEVVRLVGDLIISRGRLHDVVRNHTALTARNAWDTLEETDGSMERQLRALREAVMRIRLVPIGEVFERMRFALRDIVRETGKEIRLDFQGQETEIDKLVVDRLLEPLLHLVRNAASHGIEPRDHRLALGKSAEGKISLRARAAGDRIVLIVEDDGAGIAVDRVRERAREMELLAATEDVADGALLDLICAPGFSLRREADMASGRGVGMSVVRSTIRGLGGELSMETSAGQGTRFTIELPLTLMIADALLVDIAGQPMAIPQLVLREILQVERSMMTPIENGEIISYRGSVLPLVSLRQLFGLPATDQATVHVLVVGNDVQFTGLVVDRVLGLREIVVHPVVDPFVTVPGVAGATELADGRVSLILDAAALIRRSREGGPRGRGPNDSTRRAAVS